ncbi:MAG: VWA domain-containing protein [Planctomycetes bacterium]|nr:VWA domain-containing protein [Planctomycetota bacterium]
MTLLLASGWSFIDPWFLSAVPVIWAALGWRLIRPRAALPTADVRLLGGLPKTLRARLWMLPHLLLGLGLTAFAVALARPVTRDVVPLREKGVDIVLVIDVSSSMTAGDMGDGDQQKTRIEVARERALEFAKERKHDRVGLLTFARFPELRCPLTLDQDALAAFLRSVETVHERSPENQTAIGVALAKAVQVVEKSIAKSKVVVLLTDGENNVPDILPADAAKLAKDAGVRVHCIGIGRGRVIEHPFFGPQQIAKPEFRSLKEIAGIVDGEFFEAESGRELKRVYQRINELEKVELEDPRFRTTDLFHYPFLVGVALVLLQLLTEFGWIRRLP